MVRVLFYIAANELQRMFKSPPAWIIMAVVQFLSAVFFYVLLQQYMSAGGRELDKGVTEVVVAGMLKLSGVLLLLVSPLLTMRLISGERQLGTIALIMSAPISPVQLALGKYLGIMLFYFCLVCMVALMPLSLLPGTRLDMGQLFAGLLGLMLLVSSCAAAGLFVSSLCRSPTVAAIGTFGLLLLLWALSIAGNNASGSAAEIFAYLSLMRHYDNLSDGVFDSVDVLYYLIVSGCFVVLTIWRLDAERALGQA